MQNITPLVSSPTPSPLSDLLALDSKNKKSFLNLIKFITEHSKEANINDVFYSASHDYSTNKKQEQTSKSFTPQSVAYMLVSQYHHYSLDDLQYFVEHLKLDLTQTTRSFTVAALKKDWDIYNSEDNGEKINEAKRVEVFSKFDKVTSTISEQKQDEQWIGQHLFGSNYQMNVHDKDGAKIKYLINETKKQFAQKNIDIEPFIEKVLNTNSIYFTELFKSPNLDMHKFMQIELGYDINRVFADRPLFFHASTNPQIDYIIENGADFNLKNQKNQNYIESWAQSTEGKTVLTYLNSKSAKDVDLNQVVINFLKNDRKLGELKSIVSQLAKSLKIKDKKEILIDNNTIFYNALRHRHWKYAYSLFEALDKEESAIKTLANEMSANGVPPFLYLLADKSSSYDSRDKNGTKRMALLDSMIKHFDFNKHKSNPTFIKKLTKILIKMQVSYYSQYQQANLFSNLKQGMGLTPDGPYLEKFKDPNVYPLYNCNKNHYGNSSEFSREFQAHLLNHLNVEPKFLLDTISSSFIYNPKEKDTKDKIPFKSTNDNLFFAMHIGENVFTQSDKRKLVDTYIEYLNVFLKEVAIKLKEEKLARFNGYGFNYTCVVAFLKAFQNLNYPIYEADLKPIKELFAYLPCNREGQVDCQESITAYIEKSALENMTLKTSEGAQTSAGSRSKI